MVLPWFEVHLGLLLGFLLTIAAIAHMLRHRRSPSSTVAWLLLFVALPYVGVVLYLMFGGRKMKRAAMLKSSVRITETEILPIAEATPFDRMLRSYDLPGATAENRVSLCRTGVEGYEGMLRIIEESQKTLYIASFIFSPDDVGRDILRRLIERAAAGVEVRLLADGLGSLKTGRRFFEPLNRAGGRFAFFKPVIHVPLRSRTNLRNHRKIAVSDGRRAMAGGMNVTAEDMFPQPHPGTWQDLSFVVEGPAARHYEDIFRSDWKFASGEQLEPSAPSPESDPRRAGGAVLQVVPSGPDVPMDPLYAVTLAAVFAAKRRIWLVTPYFVPDDALAQALVIACHRGVDVRILVPEKSNHRLADVARSGFLRDIHAAGGNVLLYTQGMVHAKLMIVDDVLAMVGSANMDMRSLFLNYEVMQLAYSGPEIRAVEAWFNALAENTRTGLPDSGPWREMAEGVVRAISPLF